MTPLQRAAEAYRQAYEAAERMSEDDPRKVIEAMELASRAAGNLMRVARGDAVQGLDAAAHEKETRDGMG